MANQKAASMTIGIPGVEVIIWYNDANKRIGALEWAIPQSGIVVRARVWNTDVSLTEPVLDRTEGGPASGAENVPGNYQMVEVLDEEGQTNIELPPNIKYQFNIQTVGQ